jgi:hypothetical protein
MVDKVRGVREAYRNGWHVVSTQNLKGPVSWNQLYDWLDENCMLKVSFFSRLHLSINMMPIGLH